jgi:hypothetical protein
MREEWVEDPVRGYEENARHLLGYPESTVREYVRDLRQFQAWLSAGEEGNAAATDEAAAADEAGAARGLGRFGAGSAGRGVRLLAPSTTAAHSPDSASAPSSAPPSRASLRAWR